MARPREFNEDLAVQAALQVFWQRGYKRTTTRELASAMGLTSASLYNAFGSKHALFRTALDRYVEQTLVERVQRFETQYPPDVAIWKFLEEIIERSLNDKTRRGCLLVNTALELAPYDRTVQRTVAGVLKQAESFFRRCVTRGQEAGSLCRQQSADDAAKLLLGVFLAIRVLARSRPERALLQGLVRPAAAMLTPGSDLTGPASKTPRTFVPQSRKVSGTNVKKAHRRNR